MMVTNICKSQVSASDLSFRSNSNDALENHVYARLTNKQPK